MTPRGIRLNNPMNLEYTGADWKGLADPPSDSRFCRFVSPEYGIRAGCRVLLTYQDKYKLALLSEFINRFAPPHENDTNAYAKFVAGFMGITPHSQINVHDYRYLRPMAEAMIRMENGIMPYAPEVIDEGLAKAGVLPAPQAA